MGKEVIRPWFFGALDYKAAEAYLEKQAGRGYLLKAVGTPYPFSATYQRTEPKQVKYSIDGVFGTEEEKREYIDFAKDGGWHKTAQCGGAIIFASEEGKSPPPMQTDWEEEYRRMRRSLWKTDIPVGITVLGICWIMSKLDVDFLKALLREEFILAGLLVLYLFFGFLFFLRAIWFYVRSETAIRTQRPLKPVNPKTGQLWGAMHLLLGISAFLLACGNVIRAINMELEEGNFLGYIIAAGMFALLIMLVLPTNKLRNSKCFKKLVPGVLIVLCTLSFVQCMMG